MTDRTQEFETEAARVAPLVRRLASSDAEAASLILSCMRIAYHTGCADGIESLDIDKYFPNGLVMSR